MHRPSPRAFTPEFIKRASALRDYVLKHTGGNPAQLFIFHDAFFGYGRVIKEKMQREGDRRPVWIRAQYRGGMLHLEAQPHSSAETSPWPPESDGVVMLVNEIKSVVHH
jgi:hypothetical protein